MPVVFQKWYFRADAQTNRDVLYLFGDNERRVGYGGQAKEMRNEPNAVGVATKQDPGTFWSDDRFAHNCKVIEEDLTRAFEHVKRGGIIVLPLDGLGSGLSELPKRAPRTNAYLLERLRALIDAGSYFPAELPEAYQAPVAIV